MPLKPRKRKGRSVPTRIGKKHNSRAKRKAAKARAIKISGISQRPLKKTPKRNRPKLTRSQRATRRNKILGKPEKYPANKHGSWPGKPRTSAGKARGNRRALAGLTRTGSGRLIPVEKKVARASTANQRKQLTEQERRSAEYYSIKNARARKHKADARARAKKKREEEKERKARQQELERIKKEKEKYRNSGWYY